ncbi:uncharacterized protein LOC128558745 [Mercenaria mercenaria]|uniref:uncharacterized protein LOC128558745 n=1 Tax=Mercenaria mercenaria TaxID=6596 RepID=UPI00234EDD0D|nr:uncharacterized protein LOC128558745 [Mercenaria mercenaria]
MSESGLKSVVDTKETEKVTKPVSSSNTEKILSDASANENVSLTKSTESPEKTLPASRDEKKELLARLAQLDEKQKRLQEQRELENLRKQIIEREAYIQDLEKSVNVETVTTPLKSTTSTTGTRKSSRGKSESSTINAGARPKSTSIPQTTTTNVIEVTPKNKKSRLAASLNFPADQPTDHSGTINIETLRKLPGLRKKAKKQLAELDLFSSSDSDSSTDSSDDSSDSSSSSEDEIFDSSSKSKKK